MLHKYESVEKPGIVKIIMSPCFFLYALKTSMGLKCIQYRVLFDHPSLTDILKPTFPRIKISLSKGYQ